jgi:radical SAM superfamily enzyme YgiQ (UPF0313 family)
MGGYHATFRPEEVLENADAVCVGEAEGIWSKILDDTEQGKLKGVYNGHSSDMNGTSPDRSIFKDKKYLDVALIETGRGCRFNCTFCSITSFHKGDYCSRSVDEIVTEVKGIRERLIFIVDDNIISDPIVSEELFRGLKPLGIKWVGQATANIYRNTHLMDLMAESGCIGLLVGFESLDSDNLDLVEKDVNQIDHYSMAVRALRDRGIIVYGTFMFGFPNDSDALFERTVRFAKDTRLFLAAFNHMIPFPGTPFYDDLAKRGHLTHDRWWLSEDYRFGDAPYVPTSMSTEALIESCMKARRSFYSIPSILNRCIDLSANCSSLRISGLFFSLNLLLRKEVSLKRGLPLGVRAAG